MALVLFVGLSIFTITFYVKHEYCHYNYEFVSGECADQVISKKAYLELRLDLEKYFAEEIKDGKISDASVYFRDLNRGPVMGINELSLFSSASLLKLPVVMAVLKMAEDRPEILDIKLINEGKDVSNAEQYFSPEENIQLNVPYTVKEVIRRALVYSDNMAINMLHDFMNIEGDETNNVGIVFRDLGLILPDDLLDRDISTRAYASLFRLLYNNSYLNPEYSELVLEYLSHSHFNTGLRAGVPRDVVVSNKFGERFWEDIKQLHDCGIIYYPDNPYLLCVMTRGGDYDDLVDVIREVSKRTYEEVNSRKI